MSNQDRTSPPKSFCANCYGFDLEWMHQCPAHRVQYCRGCSCPYCEEEADEYDDWFADQFDGEDWDDE